MAKKANEIIPLQVRMREGLRKKLEHTAKGQEHSLNAEIVGRLESSFDDEARNLDYRAAVAALAGGGENAQLLSMISSALHLATVGRPKDAANAENMDSFIYAIGAIVHAHSGRPLTPIPLDELFEMPDPKHRGYMIAQAILQHHDLPPVIDAPRPDVEARDTDVLSLANLGKALGR